FRGFELGLGSSDNLHELLTILYKYPMAEDLHKALCGRKVHKMTIKELTALRDILIGMATNAEEELVKKKAIRVPGYNSGANHQFGFVLDLNELRDKLSETFKGYDCVGPLFDTALVCIPRTMPRHKVNEDAPIHIVTSETDIEMLSEISSIFVNKGYKVSILPFSYKSSKGKLTLEIRKKTPAELELSLRKNLGTV
ncbi:MAG: hypothetical protein KAS32_26145, partial [Candidatus Peribacteraceae bacterium]|nr:hypothetical protein [Candidatus Peribacteraceae bacterium]